MTETMLPPCVLLTRPIAQSVALAENLDGIRAIISPLMSMRDVGEVPALSGVGGLIFTSSNGVAALARRTDSRDLPVLTVGEATRDAARSEGWAAEMAGLTADALVASVLAFKWRYAARFLHVRGRHAGRSIAAMLSEGGLRCTETVLYDQRAMPLTREAVAVLRGTAPVICPLYSPRTARLFAAHLTGATAPLYIVAMSKAVTDALGGVTCKYVNIAPAPTGAAMRDSVRAVCAQLEARAGAH